MEMQLLLFVLLSAVCMSASPVSPVDNSVYTPVEMKSISKVMKAVDYRLQMVNQDYLQMKEELTKTNSLVADLKKELADLKSFISENYQQTEVSTYDDSSSSGSDERPSAREVVEEYTRDINWHALVSGLQQVMDKGSVEYQQLLSINDHSWGHLYQVGSEGYDELAAYLLDQGLPGNKTDEVGDSILHGAAEGGRIPVAQRLLQRGVDVDLRGWRGLTPFNKAALGGKPEMVKWLADHGANVHSADDKGMTSLHFAAEHGHLAVVKLLVALGLDVTVRDSSGLTALDWARNNHHAAVVHYLSALPPPPSAYS